MIRVLTLCVVAALIPAQAQVQLELLWERELKAAPPGSSQPIPPADQKTVIERTANLLRKHVTFRADGTAATISQVFSPPQNLEWKNLRLIKIIPAPVVPDDAAKGIQKRYFAMLGSDAGRIWDPQARGWSVWQNAPQMFFPTTITVDWKNGVATAEGNNYLPKFLPGPAISAAGAAPATTSAPAAPSRPSTAAPNPSTQTPAGPATTTPQPTKPTATQTDPNLPPGMSRSR